jgi:hypothetical protein
MCTCTDRSLPSAPLSVLYVTLVAMSDGISQYVGRIQVSVSRCDVCYRYVCVCDVLL